MGWGHSARPPEAKPRKQLSQGRLCETFDSHHGQPFALLRADARKILFYGKPGSVTRRVPQGRIRRSCCWR